MTPQPRLIRAQDIRFASRGGTLEGDAQIAWAVPDAGGAPLPCGFGRLHEAQAEPKTLAYDELVLVLEGTLGIRMEDGSQLEAAAGDLIVIPRNTTVTYFGRGAKLFFVVTPQAK